jgi:hypothetical protein
LDNARNTEHLREPAKRKNSRKKAIHPAAATLTVALGLFALALYALGAFGGSSSVKGKSYADGSLTYDGLLTGGKFDGTGELRFADGSSYVGAFRDGRFDGEGTFTAAGWTYTGKFSKGVVTGEGTLTGPDGGKVSPEEDGEAWKFLSEDGWAYTGIWGERGQTGEGTFLFPDGSRYEGAFLQGLAEGQGAYISAGGQKIYEGSFAAGRYDGQGIYHSPEGWIYEGAFRYGVFDGLGVLTDTDGTKTAGIWNLGKKSN